MGGAYCRRRWDRSSVSRVVRNIHNFFERGRTGVNVTSAPSYSKIIQHVYCNEFVFECCVKVNKVRVWVRNCVSDVGMSVRKMRHV